LIRLPIEEALLLLIRGEASIKNDARKEGAAEILKTSNSEPKVIIHKGGIAIMKIQEIREIAKTWGVNARIGRSKKDIIREIQVKEGYSPCFKTRETCESDCMWKADCLGKKNND